MTHQPGGDGRALERLEVVVHGRVQGVGYRWFARERAAGLGLDGWVRNRADGSVEVYAQGDPRALTSFQAELEAGPPGAVVDRLEVHRGPADGSSAAPPVGFEIRAGSHRGD